MHFYLNIHISRLFNSRFIRTHPFKSFLASKSWRKRAVRWFSWKLKTKKIAEAGESWAELQYLKVFLFQFLVTESTSVALTRLRLVPKWPFSVPRRSPTLRLRSSGLSMASNSSGLKNRWEENTLHSEEWPKKNTSPEKNKAHQRNQIIQQYWPLGNNSVEKRGLTAYTEAVYYYSPSVALPLCLLKTLRPCSRQYSVHSRLVTCWSKCSNQIVTNRLLSARAAGEQQVWWSC